MSQDATQRFSERARDYARFRPSYPSAAIDALLRRTEVTRRGVVADVGAGTGILTGLLLERGLTVRAIEPNAAMLEASNQGLGHMSGYQGVAAPAQNTSLPDASVELITAAQAFHWFDRQGADAEFRRILRPDGWLALLWNSHMDTPGTFTAGYEEVLCAFGQGYARVQTTPQVEKELEEFYRHPSLERATFTNPVRYDWETLLGRARSSSYAPLEGSEAYVPFTRALRAHFEEHAQEGAVEFVYQTALYTGRLGP